MPRSLLQVAFESDGPVTFVRTVDVVLGVCEQRCVRSLDVTGCSSITCWTALGLVLFCCDDLTPMQQLCCHYSPGIVIFIIMILIIILTVVLVPGCEAGALFAGQQEAEALELGQRRLSAQTRLQLRRSAAM